MILSLIQNVWAAFKEWHMNVFMDPSPVLLVICRKYLDANGRYVGELYAQRTVKHPGIGYVRGLSMIGMSLDSLDLGAVQASPDYLDTRNDFLAPMPDNVIRVGAVEPQNTDAVRKMVRALPKKNMRIILQNRFIETVLEGNPRC